MFAPLFCFPAAGVGNESGGHLTSCHYEQDTGARGSPTVTQSVLAMVAIA